MLFITGILYSFIKRTVIAFRTFFEHSPTPGLSFQCLSEVWQSIKDRKKKPSQLKITALQQNVCIKCKGVEVLQ